VFGSCIYILVLKGQDRDNLHFIVTAFGLTCKRRNRLERLARDIYSSLIGTSINYGHEISFVVPTHSTKLRTV